MHVVDNVLFPCAPFTECRSVFAAAVDISADSNSGIAPILENVALLKSGLVDMLRDPAFPVTLLLPDIPHLESLAPLAEAAEQLLAYHVVPWRVLLREAELPLVAETELSPANVEELCAEGANASSASSQITFAERAGEFEVVASVSTVDITRSDVTSGLCSGVIHVLGDLLLPCSFGGIAFVDEAGPAQAPGVVDTRGTRAAEVPAPGVGVV